MNLDICKETMNISDGTIREIEWNLKRAKENEDDFFRSVIFLTRAMYNINFIFSDNMDKFTDEERACIRKITLKILSFYDKVQSRDLEYNEKVQKLLRSTETTKEN